jgi:hypothetical protein
MNQLAARVKRVAAAVGALLAAGAAVAYVVRALRERARGTGTHRGPSAGRPLRALRGGAGEG